MSYPANDAMPVSYEEEAASWCWRIAEGALSADEHQAFDDWLVAAPHHRECFEHMVTVWQCTDVIAEMPGFLSLRAKALRAMEDGRDLLQAEPGDVTRHWRYRMVAAIALLLMVMGAHWILNARPDIYQTGIGERRVVRLDDGSRISLDASSRVSVAYSGERRALVLQRGRAKFDVAKDPLRPFSVVSGQKTIVATGTAFSVELLRDQVRVFLYEGHVSVLVQSRPGQTLAPVMVGRKEVFAEQALAPGSELVSDIGSASAIVKSDDVERSLAWEAGRISLTDEPLASAAERVNRYIDTPIIVGDATTGGYAINGIFDAGDAAGFVSAISSLYPIAVNRENGRIILTHKETSKRRAQS